MFETRSQAWREAGLLRQISPRVVKRARLEALVLVPLFVGVVILYDNRVSLLGRRRRHGPAAKELEPALETPLTIVVVIALVILGWAIARDVGRSLGPAAVPPPGPRDCGHGRVPDPPATIVLALLVALRVAGRRSAHAGARRGVHRRDLRARRAADARQPDRRHRAASARPFRVGDRVRLQGGPLAGQIEGTVSSLGLLYTTFANRRGSSDGAQQRRAERRRAAAARARGREPARATACRG